MLIFFFDLRGLQQSYHVLLFSRIGDYFQGEYFTTYECAYFSET